VRTRILTIVLAAVLGLFGVVAVVAYAHQSNQRAVSGLNPKTVMVAKSEIPAGTPLSKAWNDHLLGTEKEPISSFSDSQPPAPVAAHNGSQVVSANVPSGQILLQNMLTTASNASQGGGGLPLQSNLTAVTVNLCLDEAVGEYATADTNVAVFDTVIPKVNVQRTCDAQRQTLNAGQLKLAKTFLVLPSVRVLAIGQNAHAQSASQNDIATAATDPPASSASSSSSSSGEVLVTLAVNQQEAEQLIKIEELGLPYLALLGSNAPKMVPGPSDPFFNQQP
jgi:pilus assembly protein CpaB